MWTKTFGGNMPAAWVPESNRHIPDALLKSLDFAAKSGLLPAPTAAMLYSCGERGWSRVS
jgi:hypothetical protein